MIMSIVLPNSLNLKRLSSDRFAPSKALQAAKEKLGPAYYNSRMVECPQNAVELAKLLQTKDEIDKERVRMEELNRRSQRILLHNLQTRYSFSGRISSGNVKVTDVKLPPPGFRYHADGSPKLVKVPITTSYCQYDKLSSDDSESDISNELILETSFISSSQHKIQDKITLPDESDDETQETSLKKTQTDTEDLHTMSAKFIKQIEKELELNKKEIEKLKSTDTKVVQNPHGIKFHIATPVQAKTIGNGLERKRSSIKRCCSACQHNLKHSGEEFRALQGKLSSRLLTPWKVAPQGKSLQSKHFSHMSMIKLKNPTNSSNNVSRITSSQSSKHTKTPHQKMNENEKSDSNRQRRVASAHPKSKISSPVPNIPLKAWSSSIDIIKHHVKEENMECEAKVEDFLKRMRSLTEKPKPKVAFV